MTKSSNQPGARFSKAKTLNEGNNSTKVGRTARGSPWDPQGGKKLQVCHLGKANTSLGRMKGKVKKRGSVNGRRLCQDREGGGDGRRLAHNAPVPIDEF